MGYWWILMDVQTCWFPTLYIIQYNILMNGTLYPKKRSSFRLMFRQIVHGKRGRKLGWSSKVPSLQQTSVQIHISRLWFILFIYIIIHIYSVSRIKQKSENSFRTPLNIFPFFSSRSTRKVHFAIYHWGPMYRQGATVMKGSIPVSKHRLQRIGTRTNEDLLAEHSKVGIRLKSNDL